MNWRPVLKATAVSLVTLLVWWVGILHLDSALATMLPYDQYESIGLLYPEIYYPALPGWILAHAQPFALGVIIVTAGWMIALSVAIGAAATQFARVYGRTPSGTAVSAVVVLFVATAAIEASAQLLA